MKQPYDLVGLLCVFEIVLSDDSIPCLGHRVFKNTFIDDDPWSDHKVWADNP